MKYKYLKNQNESFRKQIEEQTQLINSQTILIDKLTSEKIDLLSKLEIQNINKEQRNLKIKIKIIDELDIIAEKNTSDLWNKVHQRVKPFDKIILAANDFVLKANENAFTNAMYKIANSFKVKHDTESSIRQMTEAMFKQEPKTVKPKSKDWYQKHNNKQRFQGKNK